ncbi:hypothetical protein [Flavobacterium sp. 5]|uniref:hypothetical protein n=1 Tax=Flavobacterium sp. 5 TaxID=2035199 RepID=UPI0012FD142B|nr:hypothetical protein [Flavobacterium sp. 5]
MIITNSIGTKHQKDRYEAPTKQVRSTNSRGTKHQQDRYEVPIVLVENTNKTSN